MRDRPSFLVTEGIKSTMTPKRFARATAAVSDAVHDFAWVWPTTGAVEVVSTGRYGGHPVVTVRVESRDYIVSDGGHAELVVNIVRLLQVVATPGNTRWPTIPGAGALDPAVRDGCAIWALPDGAEFCEIGRLFTRTSLASRSSSGRPGDVAPSRS